MKVIDPALLSRIARILPDLGVPSSVLIEDYGSYQTVRAGGGGRPVAAQIFWPNKTINVEVVKGEE